MNLEGGDTGEKKKEDMFASSVEFPRLVEIFPLGPFIFRSPFTRRGNTRRDDTETLLRFEARRIARCSRWKNRENFTGICTPKVKKKE